MTTSSLKQLSAQELVDRFVAIALGQDEAIDEDDNAKFARLYHEMDKVKAELNSRGAMPSLIKLLDHPNAQVRLKAGIATLAVSPDAARATLKKIIDRGEFPQAADARGMLRALDEGTYQPT